MRQCPPEQHSAHCARMKSHCGTSSQYGKTRSRDYHRCRVPHVRMYRTWESLYSANPRVPHPERSEGWESTVLAGLADTCCGLRPRLQDRYRPVRESRPPATAELQSHLAEARLQSQPDPERALSWMTSVFAPDRTYDAPFRLVGRNPMRQ